MKVLFILISFIGLSYSIPHGLDYAKCHEELLEHESKFNLNHISEYEIVVFSLNYMKMTEHNSNKSRTYTKGLNAFSHLTWGDFKNRLGYNPKTRNAKSNGTSYSLIHRIHEYVAPESVDWRDEGLVSHVKDQGKCGSSWAFSAVGALEGQAKKKTGRMIELSEQTLVDCSSSYGNDGCQGGLMDHAFQYVKDNRIEKENRYKYIAKKKVCDSRPDHTDATDYGYVAVESENEDALKEVVASIGPISVAIEATENFMRYGSGVFYDGDCSGQLNHGVLLVGYGTDAEQGDYWIVKNSWGPRWGEDGYIRMARNRDNNCGIATSASYPIV